MAARRAFRMEAFTVADDRVFAVDAVGPLVLELSLETGAVVRAHTWPVPQCSGRSVATAVAAVPDAIVVASPAAGGVVFIDRVTGESSTVELDAPIGSLVVETDAVWAIAHPDWADGAPPEGASRRPVVWEDPTDDEIAAYRTQLTG